MQKALIYVAWGVMSAILFVLLSPATPGVVAPNGGTLLKPLLILALNVFASLMIMRMTVLMPSRFIQHCCSDGIEVYFRPTTLLC